MNQDIFHNFPFTPDDHLIDIIDRLFQFVRQPIPLGEFINKFPKEILNARLDQLEFNSENPNVFIIKLKTENNEIELINKDLSIFGITVTDPTQLVNPLIKCKKDSPNLNLKDALTRAITVNHDKNKKLTFNGIINILKENTLNHPENKNEQIEIDTYFNFIRKLLIIEALYSDFNTTISELHIAVQYLSASKILFAYEKLRYKTTLIFPESEKSESEIHSLIDILVRIKANNQIIISNYEFFKLSYFEKKGFRYSFGKYADRIFYKAVQTGCKCFSSFIQDHFEILNLIRELCSLADYNQEVISLSKKLTCLTDIYFQTLLDLSSSKADKKYLKKYKEDNFDKFQNEVKKNIERFQKESGLSQDQLNIFYKILNAIAKLMPSFIISKNTRIGFFQQCTPQNKILVKLEETIQLKL